jgi:hypothetical protein
VEAEGGEGRASQINLSFATQAYAGEKPITPQEKQRFFEIQVLNPQPLAI